MSPIISNYLRKNLLLTLLLLVFLALLTSSEVLASSSSSSSSSSQGERLEKRMTSSAASIRFPQVLNEPRERGLTPGFVAVVVGGLSVVFAGLMV
ncbi:unnamed protein product [Tuber melanosporum]|uniref:(Perigord truffle) hypothetical protein n=1 Tax=Tuber melanosporum (strain Mel28) TaxID=656061 RepID=D5GKJ9_TUBMM|nr:uncharacterized protein GSTUM_00009598001 [Tuber melanosporum]CAZ85042.1 unnamed protein product [Tuber melanosporum]